MNPNLRAAHFVSHISAIGKSAGKCQVGQAAEIQALKAALEAQRQDVARILVKLDAGQK
ncbi:MAG TPA: hypothetical protein PLL53_00085 [Saprospiraceae bacterium]|jgi:hypothetical protein|nr:hypothetical protein [Saprospiraceae bacterium]